jgi:hypothetical protein
LGRPDRVQLVFGRRVYRQFSQWQAYAERDPILGRQAACYGV